VLEAVREPRQDFGEHQAPRRKIVSTGLHAAAGSDCGLILKRNCSISPRDLLWILASIALVTCGIGAAFASLGAWLVLPFAGIEVLAVAAAFYLNGVHAADYERLVLRDGKLVVEIREAERVARYEFPSAWVRLHEGARGPEYRLTLRSAGSEVEIGRHWDAERRQLLAQQLRRELSIC
jgi:uncharacterized membrane protein